MLKIGLLSDTHISKPTADFSSRCRAAFDQCEVIIHAGDLTDVSILSIFNDKVVHGVCGNMCNRLTNQVLPRNKRIILEGYHIGITHGAGPKNNIEERVFEIFPDVDCIVYGHSHEPVCHHFGDILMINPGSFQPTGPYGAPATYGLLEINQTGLEGSIKTIR